MYVMPVHGAGEALRNAALIISAILLTSLVISHVNGIQASIEPKEANPAGPITIIGPWFGSERDAFLLVLDAFEVATGILTVYIPIRDGDLRPILDQAFARGATPADVIFISSGFIRQASRDGHIIHVNSMINEADFLPGALDSVTVGTTIYGGAYTDGAVKPGFWYKDSLFTARGWNKNPVDYNAFTALLADIQADGMTPLVTGNGVGWPLSDMAEHFIATYGGAQMHRDLTAGTMSWTDPAVRAVFANFLVPLLTAGYFGPPVDWVVGVQDLQDEKNALYFQGTWLPTMPQITNTGSTADMRVMALPGGVANQGLAFFPDTFFIPAYTDVLGEAKLLFQFLASAEGQAIQVQQGGHIATALGVPLDDYPAGWERGVAADMAGKEVLPDMDDVVGGTFQPTFWSQLQLLWADPTQLDAVLGALQAAAPTPSANTPPAASFTVSPSMGDLTTTFALDASASSDPEDPVTALEVRWDWEDDGVWDTPRSTAKTASHQYAAVGTHTIRLEVADTAGLTDTTTGQVTIAGVSLRVGTILPLTGDLRIFGLDMRDATDLAADEINSAGVLGGSLELLHRDSQTNAAAAVNAATELVLVEGVPVIIGAAASGVSLPVAGVTVPNEVVQISPSSTSPVFSTFEPEEPGWFWRTVPSDALQGKVAGRYAFNDKGWRNVAILARDDAYGSGLAQAFQETFEGLGGTITVRVSYNPNAASFTTELTTIFNSNPEAIWWVAFPGEAELIMTQWFAATGANPTWLNPKWLWSEGTRSQALVDTLVGLGIPVQGMEGTAPFDVGNKKG